MRPVHFCFDHDLNCLFASTNRGTILRLDSNLNTLTSSDPVYNLNSLYVCRIDKTHIYAREITGKLVRWTKDDLKLDQVIELTAWSDPEQVNLPNVSHGLILHKDSVYVSMPQGALGKFRKHDLEFEKLSTYLPKALIESISFDGPTGHYAVDFAGLLYHGDADSELRPIARIAHGACHQLIYDRKFNRYWITDDFHCGLALFRAEAPTEIQRLQLTNDDVEWMSFNADQSELLVACFDRHVYRIANEPEPRVIGRIGPLKYQVKQVEWTAVGTAYALTEAGHLYRLELDSGSFFAGSTGTNAVWDLKPSNSTGSSCWAAFEDGTLRELRADHGKIEILYERNLGFGMLRRILPRKGGGIFVLAANSGLVAALDATLNVLWSHQARPLLREFALSGENLLVCSESGELTLLDARTGLVRWQRDFLLPLWCVSIAPCGSKYLVSHRSCHQGDQGTESTNEPARLFIGDLESGEITGERPVFGNIKKMSWLAKDSLLINGNGEVATSVLSWPSSLVDRKWSAWQLNTCEATLIYKERVYTTTYGYQLNTFSFKGEIEESAFPFEDYATSLAVVGENLLLAGGRGAFLSLFRLQDGLPQLVTSRSFA